MMSQQFHAYIEGVLSAVENKIEYLVPKASRVEPRSGNETKVKSPAFGNIGWEQLILL